MPENELVFDFLDSLESGDFNPADYPALNSLFDYLLKTNASQLSAAELRTFKNGMTSVGRALTQHAELQTRVAETVLTT